MRKLKILFSFVILFAFCYRCNNDKSEKEATVKTSETIVEIPLNTKSKEAMAAFQEGLVLYDQGNGQKARSSFTKAIELDPKLGIAYLFRANTANSPKEYADDLEQGKANLEGASDWEKMYYEYAYSFVSGDWDKRMEVAKKIAEKYPDAPRAHLDLGAAYQQGNQFDNAKESFKKAIELNPKWVSGYQALANAYLFNDPKDFKKAEENALKATELNPSSATSQITLGDCYRAQNNLEKARDAYAKAVELEPDFSAGYYKLGHANSYLGNLDEARKNYMDAAKHDENKAPSISNTAYTYLYGGDYKKALNYLADGSVKMESSGDSKDKISIAKMNFMDNCARIAAHYGDAATLKKMVTEMEPISIGIGNDLKAEEAKLTEKGTRLYWQSIAAATEGNIAEAKAKAEEMKKTVEPVKNPLKLDGYYFAMGFANMKEKKYADAVSNFDKTDPAWVYNKYWQAVANEAAGNKDKANAIYKEIADYNFNDVGYALIRNEVKKKAATL